MLVAAAEALTTVVHPVPVVQVAAETDQLQPLDHPAQSIQEEEAGEAHIIIAYIILAVQVVPV
jgi:hypothetical protein